MKYLKIILLTSIALVVIFAIILICQISRDLERLDTIPKTETVSVRIGNDSNAFYLMAKVWGIAGNHERIVLSKLKDSIPDHKVDYLFYTSEVFYKVENNIICIYAPESSISEPIEKSPNVKIKGLKTSDEIMDYNTHYSSYGLERISVYE